MFYNILAILSAKFEPKSAAFLTNFFKRLFYIYRYIAKQAVRLKIRLMIGFSLDVLRARLRAAFEVISRKEHGVFCILTCYPWNNIGGRDLLLARRHFV